ncbi:MAG: stage V sporulation protein T [Clostridia bacterium]|nr:stage V sporulation protein T [Clostridia bacterium]
MKATGIVRRIDDLGRVVIPKEIRRTMRIREGDPLEIYTDRDGEVIFKKYSPIGEIGDFASQYAESLSRTSGHPTCITDKDNVIAVSGVPKRELSDKKISAELEKFMEDKTTFISSGNSSETVKVIDGSEKYTAGVVVAIIAEGDTIGSVVFFSNETTTKMGEVEEMLAKSAAGFLGRHMEQ